MLVTLTFKDPDYVATDAATTNDLVYGNPNREKASKALLLWDEYLTVQYNTETGEATVLCPKNNC